ncbi:hypothetical protein EBZ37_10615, partial [bacterium]|nr:hypothetical protein [bacterium]
MSSIQEDLFPDHRLVIQTAIFVVTLFLANYYIIKPALRLTNERKRRTTGATDLAKSEIQRAEALETSYETSFRKEMDEIKSLRLAEIAEGHKQADQIFRAAEQKWEAHLVGVKQELDKSVATERSRIGSVAQDLVSTLMSRLGASALLLGLIALSSQSALASGGEGNVMESLVWPYLQFAIYFAAIVYFGNKVVHGVLESRRDALRAKLSEAKQALTDAQRKTADYEAKFASMKNEIADLRKQYLQDGKNEREKLVAEAHALAEQMAKDAERTAREWAARC